MSNESSLSNVQGSSGDGVTAQRILIAEDDEMVARFLSRMLRSEGFSVELTGSGASVLDRLTEDTALLLLDLNLPEVDGLAVLGEVRPRYPRIPILVLTARSRAESVVVAFESGADDYLNKPFAFAELLARVRSLLRRNATPSLPAHLRCGDLILNHKQMAVCRGGQRVQLSPREFSLLACLMRQPGIPVPRGTLLLEVWGAACQPTTNVVDVYMKYLRDKIDLPGMPKLIRTVRGTGYVVSDF